MLLFQVLSMMLLNVYIVCGFYVVLFAEWTKQTPSVCLVCFCKALVMPRGESCQNTAGSQVSNNLANNLTAHK